MRINYIKAFLELLILFIWLTLPPHTYLPKIKTHRYTCYIHPLFKTIIKNMLLYLLNNIESFLEENKENRDAKKKIQASAIWRLNALTARAWRVKCWCRPEKYCNYVSYYVAVLHWRRPDWMLLGSSCRTTMKYRQTSHWRCMKEAVIDGEIFKPNLVSCFPFYLNFDVILGLIFTFLYSSWNHWKKASTG